jgi:hypothetical protein
VSTPSRPGERRPDDAATRELLGAWALDAVDADERAAVEDLLARDPEAAREARSLLETSALLGEAVALAAPAAVRDATLAEALRTTQDDADPAAAHVAPPAVVPTGRGSTRPGDDRPAGTAGSSTRPGGRPRRRRTWRVLAAALALAVAVAVPTVVAVRESQRAQQAEARVDRIADLLAEPGAQVATAEVTTGGTAVAVVTADAALVTASGLTDPGAGNVYQLWVMRDGVPVPDATATTSAGVLQIGTDAYRTGDALALTVEPAAGSQTPTTEPVVVLAPA